MAYDPSLTQSAAIIIALSAAFLWGVWPIILKYIGHTPVEYFYIVIYTTSLIFIWIAGFALDGSALIGNMSEVAAIAPIKVAASFGTGVFYVAASMLSMNVMQAIGLVLSQPIISSINVLLGTAISFLIGGVPQNMTIGRIVLACAFLVAAVFLTSLASRARRPASRDEASHGKGEVTPRILILTFFGALGGVFYSTGVAFSLKSTTQPVGLSVMPFLCLLISGAWIGAMIICGSLMTRKKAWGMVKLVKPKLYAMITAASVVHYSGNILHAFATRALSAGVSWPLGVTSGLWTQVWGLAYGEFKNASHKAYLYLSAGVACYLLGSAVIAHII